MRWSACRIQANGVSLARAVRLTGQLIGDRESRVDVDVEGGPVQPDRGLTRLVRVQVDYHQNRIAARGAGLRDHALRKAKNLRPVRKMKPEIAELSQRGMRSPDRVAL